MKTTIVIIAGVTLLCGACAFGQDLGIYEESTAGNFFGSGARQMSMGGTGIASSLDGAALYYNPAALARIHRIELQLGLTHNKFKNTSSQAGGRYPGYTSIASEADLSQTKTRFGTLNLVIPVPTYRGSLSVAFGVNRIMSFDRAAILELVDDSAGFRVDERAKEFESGGIYLYSAGAGIELSPNISAGLALNVYSGRDDFKYSDNYRDDGLAIDQIIENQISEDYIGASAKAGLLVRPNASTAIGLVVETPLDFQTTQDFYQSLDSSGVIVEESYNIVEYDLNRPFIFGAGVSYRAGTFTLAGDAEYVDWSQLSYNDNPAMELDNDTLAILYRDVMNLRLGAEYQFPQAGLSLRAGLFSNPLAYNEDFVDNDRSGFSLGFGWLIDRVLMLEGAYVKGTLERHYTGPNGLETKAEDKFQTAYFTVSYRY